MSDFFVTPWTVACQGTWSMGFSRQEYWSGLPYPSPGDLPDPGIKLRLLSPLRWQVGSLPPALPGSTPMTRQMAIFQRHPLDIYHRPEMVSTEERRRENQGTIIVKRQ